MRRHAPVLCLALLLGSNQQRVEADDKKQTHQFTWDLRSKDGKVRQKAAEGLGKLGPEAAPAAKELCEAVLDSDPQVAFAAFASLARVRPDLHRPVSKIILDRDSGVRARGMEELGELGKDAKPAALFIAKFAAGMAARDSQPGQEQRRLRGATPTVQATTYKSLHQIGVDDSDVIKVLHSIAGPTTRHPDHRLMSMELLVVWAGNEECRRKELLPRFKSGLATPKLQVSYLNLAGSYGALSREFLPALKQLKSSQDGEVRDAAARAIEQIEADLKKRPSSLARERLPRAVPE